MLNFKSLFSEIQDLDLDKQKVCYNMIKEFLDIQQSWLDISNNNYDNFQRMAKIGFLTKNILGSHTNALLVNTRNGLFAVDPEDNGVGNELRVSGEYGLKELENINRFLTKRSKLLVIGAHIGTLVIPLSKKCEQIVAIEANPNTFELLKLNLIINEVTNCNAFNIAANDKSEELQFLLSRANSGGSKRKPKIDDYIYYYDNPQEIKVPAVELDIFLNKQTFDIIIMDIEGSEYFALKGMSTILFNVKVLFMEFVPHHIRQVSGIDIKLLIDLLKIFNKLIIPSKGITVMNQDFEFVLNNMFDNDISEEAIIFLK